MAFTEFYCDASTGANVNGGSDAGSPSMSDTAGTGAVSTVTHQYTSVATNGTVTVGQFISIYSGAATVAAFTARITAVSGGSGAVWVITYSTTAISGTEPTTGSTYKAQVGGCWKGPNAAEGFPFGYVTNTMTNSSSDIIRVNFKNNATYNVTAAVSNTSKLGPMVFQGYTSSVGDGGKATIDGGTSGASYQILALATFSECTDFVIQNNGASGNASGVSINGRGKMARVVVNSVRGAGFDIQAAGAELIECEGYACNQNNSSSKGAFTSSVSVVCVRCIAHDNSGNLADGFVMTGGTTNTMVLINCVADTNGAAGFNSTSTGFLIMLQCVAYNNTGGGVVHGNAGRIFCENCLFVSNGSYGINGFSAATAIITAINCAFYNNTSGQTNTSSVNPSFVTGSITLTGDPFTAASTGDFTLDTTTGEGAACRGAGRGAFTETQASYTGTASVPDVGATQNASSGGASGPIGGVLIVGSAVGRASRF